MEQTSKKTIVSLKDIFIKFDGEVILNHINLDINEKEFVTILGPSGCGKTTTLRIIGGFVEPDSGDVIFGGKRINGTPPNKRNVFPSCPPIKEKSTRYSRNILCFPTSMFLIMWLSDSSLKRCRKMK